MFSFSLYRWTAQSRFSERTVRLRVLLDDEDAECAGATPWRLYRGEVVAVVEGRLLRLANLVVGDWGVEVEYVDGNRRNLQKGNLRLWREMPVAEPPLGPMKLAQLPEPKKPHHLAKPTPPAEYKPLVAVPPKVRLLSVEDEIQAGLEHLRRLNQWRGQGDWR